jgi:hypothetical protein
MPFFNAWKKNILRSLESWVGISAAVFLLGALCLGLPMLIEATTDLEQAPNLLIGGAVAFLVIVVAAVAVYAVFVLRGRRTRLDAAFNFPTVAGRGYSFNGRQYHGLFRDRQMDSYYYRGPTLDIYLSTTLQTRMGIGPRNALGTFIAGMANRAPLALTEAAFAEKDAYADDAVWAAQWLAKEETKTALARLLKPLDDSEWRMLTLQPGSIRLILRYTEEPRITPEAAQQWLEDLAAAIRAAERMPAPTVSSTRLSALERTSQENRGAFTLPAFLLVMGILLFPTICFVAALVVLVTVPAAR